MKLIKIYIMLLIILIILSSCAANKNYCSQKTVHKPTTGKFNPDKDKFPHASSLSYTI